MNDITLDPGEQVLWTGRPKPGYIRSPGTLRALAMAIAAVLVCGAFMAWTDWGTSLAPQLGLLPLLAFCLFVWQKILSPASRLARTRYSLTTRRALIQTGGLFGLRTDVFPITDAMAVELDMAQPPSLYFGARLERRDDEWVKVKCGFERIEDADHVYALIRRIQQQEPRP